MMDPVLLCHSMVAGVQIQISHHPRNASEYLLSELQTKYIKIVITHNGSLKDLYDGPCYFETIVTQENAADIPESIKKENETREIVLIEKTEALIAAIFEKKRRVSCIGYYLELQIKQTKGVRFKNLLIKQTRTIFLN